jgi:hypothetical protein
MSIKKHTFGKVNIYGGIPGVNVNPILVHEVEQFSIGAFGYYIIDNEYMYILVIIKMYQYI